MSSSSEVEILVHIAAPSRTVDDTKYRQLAQSYLQFHPHKREIVASVSIPNHPQASSSKPLPASLIRDSQDLSFTGAIDNLASPHVHYAKPGPVGTPPSEIGDSYPLTDNVARISPTKALRRYAPATAAGFVPGTPPEQQSGPKKRPAPSDSDHDITCVEETRISSSIISHNDSITSTPPAARLPAANIRADSEPTPPKRIRELASPTIIRSSSDPISLSASNDDTATLFEIRPPSPLVAIDTIEPDALVPPKLAKLAVDLSSRYRPVAHIKLPALDRGYWLIDCKVWPLHVREEAWLFLSNYIRSGLAGWGVWCHRDEEKSNHIRIYGWAHVAKHTYLLLYLASGRHVKTTGATWYGSDGEACVTVPPAGQS